MYLMECTTEQCSSCNLLVIAPHLFYPALLSPAPWDTTPPLLINQGHITQVSKGHPFHTTKKDNSEGQQVLRREHYRPFLIFYWRQYATKSEPGQLKTSSVKIGPVQEQDAAFRESFCQKRQKEGRSSALFYERQKNGGRGL